jgi:GTP cyclohydrolase I
MFKEIQLQLAAKIMNAFAEKKRSAFINVFVCAERLCYCMTFDKIDRNYSKAK